MTERMQAENGSPEEHPMRKVLRSVIARAPAYRAEQKRLEAEGRALVLCGPDCPAKPRADIEHAHTWWDMYRMAGKAEYECRLVKRFREAAAPRVDVPARLHSAGVGKAELERLTQHEGMDERPAFRVAREWWGQRRPMLPPDGYGNPARAGPMPYPWLLLLGDTGTGKTVAAAWCLQQHFRGYDWNGHAGGSRTASPGLCVLASELLTLDLYSTAGRDRLDDMRRCGLLVLDDLGAVAFNDVALGLLYDVLDTRYRQQRRTVMTANLSAVDFERRFDFRGGTRGEDGNEGRIYRRALERGFMAHLTRNRAGKMGWKLLIAGRDAKGQS
jgi:hypothetical protein